MGNSYTRPEYKSKWHPEYVKGIPSMTGKVVAITGCTTGLGRIAARDLASKGARVIMLNRPSERAQAAQADVRTAAAPGGEVQHVDCDLQDFASVRAAAAKVLSLVEGVGLDVLCNNAGIMALPQKATVDGYDAEMQTNHISHFLLTSLLMPALERAATLRGEARVVNHTSAARNSPSTPLSAENLAKATGDLGGPEGRWERYHQTKLANIVFTLALQEKLAEQGSKVKVLVAAPGLAASNLQQTTAAHSDGWLLSTLMMFGQSEEDGTMPLLECMTAPGLAGGTLVTPKYKGLLGWLLFGDGFTGPPVVTAPRPLCTSREAMHLLWSASEAAVGPFFR